MVKSGKTAEKGTNVKSDGGKIVASEPPSISEGKSLERVRNEVQTIIDIMGPGTPNFDTSSTSAEHADNEESVFTDTKTTTFEEELRILKHKCKMGCPAPCNKRIFIEEPSRDSDKTEPPTDVSLRCDTVSRGDTTNLALGLEETPTISDDYTITYNYHSHQCMCPPPLRPANVCVNSECMCPQVARYFHNGPIPMPYPPNYEPVEVNIPLKGKDRNPLVGWLKKMASSYGLTDKKNRNNPDYYKMDVKGRGRDDGSPPKKLVFELVSNCDQHPKDEKNCINKKLLASKASGPKYNGRPVSTKPTVNVNVEKEVGDATAPGDMSERGKTRVDVYYFDHGNSTYFRTTDRAPIVAAEIVAEKTEAYTTKFWAEIFGTVHIGCSFVTSFILQLFRFLLYSIIRPLTIGLIQLASDYFFKPFLATVFNGVVQPPLIFLYNVATSIRDLCDPIAEALGYFLGEIAQLFRACRLVEVNRDCHAEKSCRGEKCRNCSNRRNAAC